jgi:hypothetical protein
MLIGSSSSNQSFYREKGAKPVRKIIKISNLMFGYDIELTIIIYRP